MSDWVKSETIQMPSPTQCGGSIFITYSPGKYCMVSKGKSGGCLNAMSEALGRLASKLVELGHKDIVIDQLKNIKCASPHPYGADEQGNPVFIESCPDSIAKALMKVQD